MCGGYPSINKIIVNLFLEGGRPYKPTSLTKECASSSSPLYPDLMETKMMEEKEDKGVKLHGSWASGYVQRVKWALQLKQIKYDYIEEDLSNKSESLLQYNPVYKKVPVLVHGGNPISESTVILEYIEQVWPQTPLLPHDPHQRAISRFWIQFGEQKNLTFFKVMLARTPHEQEKAKKDAIGVLKTLEEEGLGDKVFFNGDSIGLVDLSFGWMSYSLDAFEDAVGVKLLEPSTFPRLHAWAQRFKEIPVIKQDHPDHQNLVLHLRRARHSFLANPPIIT